MQYTDNNIRIGQYRSNSRGYYKITTQYFPNIFGIVYVGESIVSIMPRHHIKIHEVIRDHKTLNFIKLLEIVYG